VRLLKIIHNFFKKIPIIFHEYIFDHYVDNYTYNSVIHYKCIACGKKWDISYKDY
jgi:hypothetical protein